MCKAPEIVLIDTVSLVTSMLHIIMSGCTISKLSEVLMNVTPTGIREGIPKLTLSKCYVSI